jgi:hypothetical protein
MPTMAGLIEVSINETGLPACLHTTVINPS